MRSSGFLILAVLVALLSGPELEAKPLQNYANKAHQDSFWKIAKSDKVGFSEKSLTAALAYINQSPHEIHSFSIIKNGKLIADYYGQDSTQGNKQRTPEDTHELHSTTKTITSLLIGIAIEEKLIPSEHSAVLPFFKKHTTANIDHNKTALSIAHLLSMQSGLQYSEGADDQLFSTPVSAMAFLDRPMVEKPGSTWNYSSGNSQILAELLTTVSGLSPREYAEKKLFSPLGIKQLNWYSDPSGTEYGGWGLFLTPRDLARIGYMIMNKGRWQGKQIVPQAWLEKMLAPHAQSPWALDKYGYHIWLPAIGGFASAGYKGQDMFMLPKHDLLIVFTAELPYQQADSILLDIINRFILPAIEPAD